ncbi:MAG: hypothetical protein AAF429_06005 [Pseudomonadota bacterium]
MMTYTLSGRAKAVFIGCILALVLSGCSRFTLDPRQETNGPFFGFVFPAQVVEVVIVKSEAFGAERFSRVGATAAELLAENAFEGEPLVSFISALYAAIGEATVGEVEEVLRTTRCMYIAKPLDRSIYTGIRENIIFDSGIDEDDLDGAFFDDAELLRDIRQAEELRSRPRETPEFEADLISLPQTCDPKVLPPKVAIFTYADTGGTVHPMTPRLAAALGLPDQSVDPTQ